MTHHIMVAMFARNVAFGYGAEAAKSTAQSAKAEKIGIQLPVLQVCCCCCEKAELQNRLGKTEVRLSGGQNAYQAALDGARHKVEFG